MNALTNTVLTLGIATVICTGNAAEPAKSFWKEPVVDLSAVKLLPAKVELVAEPKPDPSFMITPGSRNFVASNPALASFRKEAAVNYRLVPDGLQSNAKPFSDREYAIKTAPEYLKPLTRLQTKMEDKKFADERFSIVLSAPRPVYVFLALDERLQAMLDRNGTPGWLEGFRPTGGKITTDDPIMTQNSAAFLVFVKQFPEGNIVLGPCCAQPGSCSMYFAFFAEKR